MAIAVDAEAALRAASRAAALAALRAATLAAFAALRAAALAAFALASAAFVWATLVCVVFFAACLCPVGVGDGDGVGDGVGVGVGLVGLDGDVETTVTPELVVEVPDELLDVPAPETNPETTRFAFGEPRPVTRS